MSGLRITFTVVGFLLICVLAIAAYVSSQADAPTLATEGDGGMVSSRGPVSVPEDDSKEAETSGGPSNAADQDAHPLDPLLEIARDLKEKLDADVRDYTAIMVKRERIKGRLGGESRMLLKVRNRRQTPDGDIPLAAYIKFLEPRSTKGREVIWVEGENDNRLVSHEAGMLNLKRFNLEPEGMLAMMGNKYPVTEIGLSRLVEKLIEKGERDRAIGPCTVETIEGQRVGDRECRLYQVIHPNKMQGFDFHIAQIFVDVERNIPLRYAAFMWPEEGEEPPLEEEYTYLDVKLNVGLTDADFDPDNSQYDFP